MRIYIMVRGDYPDYFSTMQRSSLKIPEFIHNSRWNDASPNSVDTGEIVDEFIENMLSLYTIQRKINISGIMIGQTRRFSNPVNQIGYSLVKSMFIVFN